VTGYGDGQPFPSFAEPWGMAELRKRNPRWEFTCDLAKVTGTLRDDPGVHATPGPVPVAVMANVMNARRVAEGRPASPC
jgi:hypothetical protein